MQKKNSTVRKYFNRNIYLLTIFYTGHNYILIKTFNVPRITQECKCLLSITALVSFTFPRENKRVG